MTVVVDSNIFVALFINLPYTNVATDNYQQWLINRERLIAPVLFEYEVVSIIQQLVYGKYLSKSEGNERMKDIFNCNISLISTSTTLHQAALNWAQKLNQSKAYDAQYVALAEQENAQFWSADKRLINALQQQGINWAHAITG